MKFEIELNTNPKKQDFKYVATIKSGQFSQQIYVNGWTMLGVLISEYKEFLFEVVK